MESVAYKLNARVVSNKYRTSPNDRVRVCFYARVSTQHEAQMNALDNQLQWYNSILREHPNWDKVAVYVDRGVTGTQAKKRQGFMQMIEDAGKGMFDLICTREVSRFARNTVDSLEFTRNLRNMGVEVFFYNDNIWSCESDGELRLTIMSAMAQEESKHISERVLAGQKISREKGVLYGNGNILGYKLIKGRTPEENTYEIVEEDAETIRMIYDWYLLGMGIKAIASKLIENHRRTASGNYNWEPSNVLRILNNKTYAGYKSYNKSFTRSYLEHSRVAILDKSQYQYVKGDFPSIIPEEKWNQVQELKRKKVTPFNGKMIGKTLAKDKWSKCLRCECGSTYKKYKWRINKDGEECYGYQCRHQVSYRKRSFRIQHGLDGEGYCDVPSICEWKLDFMAKKILERLWRNPNETIEDLMQAVEMNYVVEKSNKADEKENERLQRELQRLMARKENLTDMRLDDLMEKEEYERRYKKLNERINEIEQILSVIPKDATEPKEICVSDEIERIKELLDTICDLEQKQLNDDLVDAIITRVTPCESGTFKWYIQSGESVGDTLFEDIEFVLCDKFTLTFEEAKEYRKSFGNYIRSRQWNDLNVEVYVRNCK